MTTNPDSDPADGPATFSDRPVVLLVDDTPQYLTVLGELLAPFYSVRIANSGKRGIELAVSEPRPDLILLDIMMPDIDGHAVLKALRSDSRTNEIPIMFITSKGDAEDEQLGFDLGAADYVTKPFNPAVVLARVNTHVALKRARDRLHQQNLLLAEELEERRRSEANVRDLNLALQRSVRNLEAFSYTVSHDLRAPLRRMIGFAQLLLADIEAGELKDVPSHVARICSSADNMNHLIDDLLSVAKIERSELKLAPIDMNAMVDRVLAEMPGRDRVHVDVGPLNMVRCDESSMRQVWTNLIANAIKYSAKKPRPEISIQSEVAGDETIFSVRDNGAGFNPTFVDKLFNVFSRLHGPWEFEGNGVGLAIVRSIVELHGGRVWAKGKPGEGATFYFSLPASLLLNQAIG